MPSELPPLPDFDAVKARLDEIADLVSDENISLDDALDLYEEAVTRALAATDLLEEGIVVDEEQEADGQAAGDGGAPAADAQDANASAGV